MYESKYNGVKLWTKEDVGKSRMPNGIEGPPPIAYLEHQCDEWQIGGKKEVKAMIADLQAILAKM